MKTFAFTECAFGRDRPKFTQLKVRSKGCPGASKAILEVI